MPKMKVEMMMFTRLKCMSNIAISPSTMSQLSRMGMKPSSVWRTLPRKLKNNTSRTNSIDTHCRMLKSPFSWFSVSVV